VSAEPDPRLVDELRAAGCVFAEEEALVLQAEARTPGHLELMVARRVAGEPLEQIVGWAEFCGIRIAVTPGVFVPRRRTEALVDLAVAILVEAERPVVVDLCCGTGAIGVAIAARVEDAELHVADVDPTAVACARRNVTMGEVHEGDLYDALPGDLAGRVDVLAVNAPYVPTDEIAMMPSDARDHEHRIALDGGPDGLEVHRRVAAGARHWLRPGGTLLIETGRRQADATAAACAGAGLAAGVVVREVSTLVRAISSASGSSGTMAR
jgi:release factor glutamine methyltransferase